MTPHCVMTPAWMACRWCFVWVILLVLTGACGHGRNSGASIAAIAGAVYPLNTLEGIQLGETALSVRTRRAGVAESPYVGLAERLGSDTVYYRFRIAPIVSEAYLSLADGGVPPGAELAVVELHLNRYQEDGQSLERWRELREQLRRTHGTEDECFEMRQPIVTSHAAAWYGEGYDLTVLFTPKWTASSIVSGDRTYAPLVRVVINGPSAPLPGLVFKVPVECR